MEHQAPGGLITVGSGLLHSLTQTLLARHGLAPRPGLTVRLLPSGGTAASVAFWGHVADFAARTRGRGLFLVRTPRYGLRAARVLRSMPLVAEVHLGDFVKSAPEPPPDVLPIERASSAPL